MFEAEHMSVLAIGLALGVSKTKVKADLSRSGIRPYTRPGFRATDYAWGDLIFRQACRAAYPGRR